MKSRESIKDHENYVQVSALYCIKCNIGFIEYKHMRPKYKNNNKLHFVEDRDKYNKIKLSKERLKVVTGVFNKI